MSEEKKQDSSRIGWLLFFVGFFGALIAGWVIFPQVLYSTRQQPLSFNHATHQENAGMSCEDCHQFRPDGTYAGIPGVAKCSECHEEAMTDSKVEALLISEYIEPGKEIPWFCRCWEPDNVFFSHAAHVKMAGMECAQCHGDVAKQTSTPPVRVDRLTGYRDGTMKMYVCENCHAKEGVSNSCDVCHK